MGLDMYARTAGANDFISPVELKKDVVTEEIHYWRKHHDLHGWMKALYLRKGGNKEFNCEIVELTMEDLLELEMTIKENLLPQTIGFFFGNNPPDEESVENDMNFIEKARDAIKNGRKVYYDSWW
jgi:hypothetical protein